MHARFCDINRKKLVKFVAIRGKKQAFAVMAQIHEVCESRDGREKNELQLETHVRYITVLTARRYASAVYVVVVRPSVTRRCSTKTAKRKDHTNNVIVKLFFFSFVYFFICSLCISCIVATIIGE